MRMIKRFTIPKTRKACPKDNLGFKVSQACAIQEVSAFVSGKFNFQPKRTWRSPLEHVLKCPVIIAETILSEKTGDQVINEITQKFTVMLEILPEAYNPIFYTKLECVSGGLN